MTTPRRCVYLIVTAAPPVLHIAQFINQLHDRHYDVCVIATPTAATWINLEDLAQTTGCRTRVNATHPYDQDPLPAADLVITAPLTFNTLNKWATGINDNLAVGILNEILTTNIPIIAALCIKTTLRQHPAYHDNLTRLTTAGVTTIDTDTITNRDTDGLATFNWSRLLQELPSAQ